MSGTTHSPVQSMTGFARADGVGHGSHWAWEIRSVNGKGLDVRYRGAAGVEQLEQAVRARVASRFNRGSIQLSLSLQREASPSSVRINRLALEELARTADELRAGTGAAPAVEQLLGIKGIVEIVDDGNEDKDELRAAILSSLDSGLDSLATMRRSEGEAIAGLLTERLDRIGSLLEAARSNKARTPEAIRARLAGQVETLLEAAPSLDPERLHQEAVLLATKADIDEELDRLGAHIDAARKLLTDGGAVGRRLDFLAQEFNRETNTLCAKSNDRSLTAIGLDLKAAVDQLREQIQNLE